MIPQREVLVTYDIVIITFSRFDGLIKLREPLHHGWRLQSPLADVHFKRIIVDEGHRLGHSTVGHPSDLLLVLNLLATSARWVVSGTPSTGLFGVDNDRLREATVATAANGGKLTESSAADERKDLWRIGNIASLFLKARPWANSSTETGDTPAEFDIYVMQQQHSRRSGGRKGALRATLDSLIVRHRRDDIASENLLPAVTKTVVLLDGSYQDRLSMSLFSMMIAFNAILSERKDRDYFFHPSQRKFLLELVSNMRQSSFFGGVFFSPQEIRASVEIAEKFLKEKKVPVSAEDEQLLHDALALGKEACENHVKGLAELYHEVPIYVEGFPGGEELGQA